MKFSVSMCVYGKDKPEWFRKSVDSILNQSVTPNEVVLVVDGPVPDELDSVIKECEENNLFKVIRFAENKGHGVARQCGLENCSNELVAIMDADDVSVYDRFEQQLKLFQDDDDTDIVGGDISEFIGEEENIVAYRLVPKMDEDIKKYIKTRSPFNQMTVMFKRSSALNSGGYIDWFCEEDYYLWLRMLLCGCKMKNTGTVLVNARVGKETYKRRGGTKYFKSEIKLQKYMLNEGIIGFGTYTLNVVKRLILQVLMPNFMREWVFRKFARKKQDGNEKI